MISMGTFKQALAAYVDTEICPHLTDWRKWAIPVGSSVYIEKIDALTEQHKETLISLGFLSTDGDIDIEKVYKHFREVADKAGEIKQVVPILGEVKIGVTDIDKLYKLCVGG